MRRAAAIASAAAASPALSRRPSTCRGDLLSPALCPSWEVERSTLCEHTPVRRFAWGVCVLVAPWTDLGCSCAIGGLCGCAMEWSTALASNVVTIVRRSTVSFDAGMCALLRLALAGMRGLGNLLNVEADRLERDMSALEHFGRACIFFIMLHAIAAILCAMGRLLQFKSQHI